MSLSNDLMKPVREKGGSIASNRLDYQKDWSLCKLLEIHESGNDYVLIFEHDDDLLILDSEDKPKKISFYQVKTKDTGNWKLGDLIKRPSSEKLKLSYLGKLYSNKIKYGKKTNSLNFISNAKFDISSDKFGEGLKLKEICLNECNKKELNKISNQLKVEHTLKGNPECGIIFLKVSDLSLSDSSSHTKGKISDFISKLNPDKNYRVDLIYKEIFNEIRRKCNYESMPSDLNELKSHKGISKKQFTKMLEVMGMSGDSQKFDDIWNISQQRLNQEKEDVKIIISIKREWIRYEANIIDQTDSLHIKLCSLIKMLIEDYVKDNKKIESLKEFLNTILERYKQSEFNKNYQEVYNDGYIKAVILGKYYE